MLFCILYMFIGGLAAWRLKVFHANAEYLCRDVTNSVKGLFILMVFAKISASLYWYFVVRHYWRGFLVPAFFNFV